MSNPVITPLTLQTMTMGAMRVQMAEILGEPWFYAPSLAQTLEYRDTSNMIRIVPDDEKALHPVQLSGGIREANFISEPSFYSLMFRSHNTTAKQFQEWILEEMLSGNVKYGHQGATKRIDHCVNHTENQWQWLKENRNCLDLIPLALAGYNSVQITRMLGYKTKTGITARKQIDKLKELGFLPQVIEPRTKQLERRIKAELTAAKVAIAV